MHQMRSGCLVVTVARLLGLSGVARGQDSMGEPAPEALPDELVNVPVDLPGHEEGPRRRPKDELAAAEAPAEAEPEAAPEWFGGKPLHEWSRLTGNWGGARDSLERVGVFFNGSYTMDWSAVFSGGVDRDSSYRHLLDVNLKLDFEKLVGLKGGTFFLDFYSTSGESLSRDVGDFTLVSNIETAEAEDQIAELWYEQRLFDDVLRIKFGKVEANSEFAFLNHGADFVNSGAAFPSTFQGFPTYPEPATSLNVFVYPAHWLYAGFGWYDGATLDGFATGGRGPATFFSDSKSSSWSFIGEMGVTAEELGFLRNARLALGGLGHTNEIAAYDGGTQDGAAQFYALAEALVWKRVADDPDDKQGLAAVVRYCWADEEVTVAGNYLAGGVQLTGTFSGRESDTTGVFASWLDMSDADGAGFDGDEWVIEWFYKVQVTPWLSVKPDLQYVIDPSGNQDIDDALVGILRVEVVF
ncbi:MAG: carbohydrate porin [Planctomycetota bacterium]|nr:carbohydrate porin [Planctomycetota bacterium]